MTFNRLAVVVGVLAVAGFGYAAGRSESTPEEKTVQRGKAEKSARAGNRDRDRRAEQARKEQPRKAADRLRDEDTVYVVGTGFEAGATVTFFDGPSGDSFSFSNCQLDGPGRLICSPVPPKGVGGYKVRVENGDGWPDDAATSDVKFEYIYEQITIDHCEPPTWHASARLRGANPKAAAPARKE
jgi:hypothetical protein